MSKRRVRFPHSGSELWHISTCWPEKSPRQGMLGAEMGPGGDPHPAGVGVRCLELPW